MTSDERPDVPDEHDDPANDTVEVPAEPKPLKNPKIAKTDGAGGAVKKKKKKKAPEPVIVEVPVRQQGLTVLVGAAAVVLLAAAIVFGVLFVQARGTAADRLDSTRAQSAERNQVLRTAQKVAIDFSSYDYKSLDENFDRVAGQLTASFAKSYRSTSASLKATLSRYQAVGTAKVLDAGVASLSGDRAVVVVFLDQTVTSKVSKTPTIDRNRVRVTLQHTGDRWLVSKLDLR